jgi:KRAB domain-containing zinc finger protein
MATLTANYSREVLSNIKQEPPVEFLLVLPQEQEPEVLVKPIKEEFLVKPIKEEFLDGISEPAKRENSDGKFYCDECSYVGKAKHLLAHHKHIHNQRYECETCASTFSYLKTYKTHLIMAKHGVYAEKITKKLECDECDKSFATGEYLQKHKKYSHAKEKLECDYCSKVFSHKRAMKLHIFNHVKVPCRICHRKVNKFLISRHFEEFHKRGNIQCQCDLCGKKTESKRNLKSHIIRCHPRSSYFCPFCREKFERHSGLLDHRKIHINENHWKCSKCFFRTETKSSLRNHVMKAHENPILKKAFKCKCKNRAIETDHEKIHIGFGKFKCLHCKFMTTTMNYVQRHVDLMHTNY